MDYEAIAEIIRANKKQHAYGGAITGGTYIRYVGLTRDLADYFAADNPRFDRQRFIDACNE